MLQAQEKRWMVEDSRNWRASSLSCGAAHSVTKVNTRPDEYQEAAPVERDTAPPLCILGTLHPERPS